MLLSVVLGLTFPSLEELVHAFMAGDYAFAAVRLLLYTTIVASTIYYWLATKRWAAHLPALQGVADHMMIALFGVLFYLLARYATASDLTIFFSLVLLQGLMALVADLWFTFGVIRRLRGLDPRADAIYRTQASWGYLLRSAVVPAVCAALLFGYRSRPEPARVVALGLAFAALMIANEMLVARWRHAAIPEY